MMKAETYVKSVHFGYDKRYIYFRVVPAEDVSLDGVVCEVLISSPAAVRLALGHGQHVTQESGQGAFNTVADFAFARSTFSDHPEQDLQLNITFYSGHVEVERVPRVGTLAIPVLLSDLNTRNWLV
jgi:hypothetical protein